LVDFAGWKENLKNSIEERKRNLEKKKRKKEEKDKRKEEEKKAIRWSKKFSFPPILVVFHGIKFAYMELGTGSESSCGVPFGHPPP